MRDFELPKILGILLIIGGCGYLIDFLIFFLVPGIHVKISQWTFIGELLLPLWLLAKGVNVEAWQKRTADLASSGRGIIMSPRALRGDA